MKYLLLTLLLAINTMAARVPAPTVGTNGVATVINPMARPFLAQADGTADDTAAVKAAYDAAVATGSKLLFPPGNWLFNLTVTNSNVTIEFDSSMGYDVGPIAITNQVRPANQALPVLQFGDGTNWAKSCRLIGATFRNTGNAGSVAIRLAGGAWEVDIIGANFYGFATNIWVQGSGSLPCSLNNFTHGSSLAANISNSRGIYVASPAEGSGFTTATRFQNFYLVSQEGSITNAHVMEVDAAQVELNSVYFDLHEDAPILINYDTALVSDQQPVLRCGNVIFDGSQFQAILKINYSTYHRIIDVVKGVYAWNGRAEMLDGTLLEQEVCVPIHENTGHAFNSIIHGPLSFMRFDVGTTNQLGMQIYTEDALAFNIRNTNGPVYINGRTNVVIQNSGTNRISVHATRTDIDKRVLILEERLSAYSDAGTNTVRIVVPELVDNTVYDGLHIDTYSHDFTQNEGTSLSIGLKQVAGGEYTSRIVHYGNIDNNHGTRLKLQTHAVGAGTWNDSLTLDESGHAATGGNLDVGGAFSVRDSGTATLVGGTVVVNNSVVAAGSIILLTTQLTGGTVGSPYISTRTPGVSFTITSTSGTDTSTVGWFLVTP